jgi:AcrR family transcriptional regulator
MVSAAQNPSSFGSDSSEVASRRGARTSLWSEESPAGRRSPLSRAAIVAAAVELADAEGLEAVSIRGVAARLSARPMTLYSHIGSKDDLLDHMLELASVDTTPAPADLPTDWRDALRMIAVSTRRGLLRHPWILSLMGRRIPFGPNALNRLEASLAAVSGLDVDRETKIDILVTVGTFTIGQVVREIAEQSARQAAGEDPHIATRFTAWVASATDYVQWAADTGRYPHMQAFGPVTVDCAEHTLQRFERRLNWVLAGIEASLPGRVPDGQAGPAGGPGAGPAGPAGVDGPAEAGG